jgi:predicted methyltransferase
MLTTPDSAVARHRLSWAGPGPVSMTALRLAQIRASSHALYPAVDAPRAPADARVCGSCDGFGFTAGHGDVDAITSLRPPAVTEIDQCHLDAASLRRRVTAMAALRPVAASRVAFIGDDDLASVALLRARRIPELLVVADIDQRVLSAVETDARRLGYGDRVTIRHMDFTDQAARHAFLDRYGESFDLVVTDPPYAEDGMRLFTDLAMRLTTFGGEIHLAMPALLAEGWTAELLLQVQQDLTRSGFAMERVIPGAFTYLTSDVISSLIIARRIPGSRLPPAASGSTGRFYTTRTPPGQMSPHLLTPGSGTAERSTA